MSMSECWNVSVMFTFCWNAQMRYLLFCRSGGLNRLSSFQEETKFAFLESVQLADQIISFVHSRKKGRKRVRGPRSSGKLTKTRRRTWTHAISSESGSVPKSLPKTPGWGQLQMETWEEDGEDDQSCFWRQKERDWQAGEGVMAGVIRGELGELWEEDTGSDIELIRSHDKSFL